MKTLIILEGPDRVGKTSFAKRYANDTLGTFLLSQPNPTGPLGFLRDIVKYDLSIENFARQLLHAVSHIWDTHLFGEYDHIIMDRSYISGLIYGRGTGLTEDQIGILRGIHRNAHNHIIQKYGFHVLIVNFSPSKPFGPKDDSMYERLLGWDMLKDTYTKLFDSDTEIFDGREVVRNFAPIGDMEHDYKAFKSLVNDFIEHL